MASKNSPIIVNEFEWRIFCVPTDEYIVGE